MPAIMFPTKKLFSFIVLLFANVFYCPAQTRINLKEVTKFELTIGYSLRVEVTRENNHWVSSQIKKADFKAHDSTRVFIKNIPDTLLSQLLDIIAQPDTGININLFNIKNDDLISTIDSVSTGLTAAQKLEFADMLQSKPIVEKSLRKALHPVFLDDRTYYSITIVTANSKKYTIHALSFADLYNLPWHIDNISCYNPAIATAFAYITGDNSYNAREKKRLLYWVTSNIYHANFRTRFGWNNFKTEYPASFAAFKNTFSPVNFSFYKGKVIMTFKSSRLPDYLHINAFFKPDDVAAASRYKRYEDTLARFFSEKNFLIRDLKTQPNLTVYVSPYQISEYGYIVIRDIKKYYPGIAIHDVKNILILDVRSNDDNQSVWLLTPDNKVVLIKYKGIAGPDDIVGFLNAEPVDINMSKRVCIVFDAKGKVISNHNPADVYIW